MEGTIAMMTDIEIADQAEMKPIKEIAAQIGLGEDDIEQYGKYKAKISLPVKAHPDKKTQAGVGHVD